jgi:hypothetical protein
LDEINDIVVYHLCFKPLKLFEPSSAFFASRFDTSMDLNFLLKKEIELPDVGSEQAVKIF